MFYLDSKSAEAEIAISRRAIAGHLRDISECFASLGESERFGQVKIRFGTEIELTAVAGAEAHTARAMQLALRHELGEDSLDNDLYMPTAAQLSHLTEGFLSGTFAKKAVVRGVKISGEYTSRTGLSSEEVLHPANDGGKIFERLPIAMSGLEFISSPRSPLGTPAWINKLYDTMTNKAPSLGLKRIDTRALPSTEILTNSIHIHASMHVKDVNVLQAQTLAGEMVPSDLLLCICRAAQDYLSHSMYLFARSGTDYIRFSEEQSAIGPSSLGIYPRKEQGRFGIGMIRGGGRFSQRAVGSRGRTPDEGPMRFELRVPCPGAAGHPNKTAYPAQRAMPYQMIEAYMHILSNGTAMWKERELQRRIGIIPQNISEKSLEDYPGTLPRSLDEAKSRFLSSPIATNYWGGRVEALQALTDEMDALHRLDKATETLVKGPHVVRSLPFNPVNLLQSHSRFVEAMDVAEMIEQSARDPKTRASGIYGNAMQEALMRAEYILAEEKAFQPVFKSALNRAMGQLIGEASDSKTRVKNSHQLVRIFTELGRWAPNMASVVLPEHVAGSMELLLGWPRSENRHDDSTGSTKTWYSDVSRNDDLINIAVAVAAYPPLRSAFLNQYDTLHSDNKLGISLRLGFLAQSGTQYWNQQIFQNIKEMVLNPMDVMRYTSEADGIHYAPVTEFATANYN